jgi:hypothetical protein
MLGLSPEFQAGDLPIRIRCAKILVQSFEPVPMVEATSLELPRDSQKAEVGTPIVLVLHRHVSTISYSLSSLVGRLL